MDTDRILSAKYLERFDFEETKKNVIEYFLVFEDLKWTWTKLNIQRGLVVNFEDVEEYQRQSYIPIGKDMFNIAAKELKEEELIKYIASYFMAIQVLTNEEQLYIDLCFRKGKYEVEITEMLGIDSSDSRIFRTLKRSALYKFADYLGIAVEKKNETKEKEGIKI